MCLSLVLFSTLFSGSVFAAKSPLNETVDSLLGVRYQYGGTTKNGFDCSGFTSYVFQQFDITLSRSSRDQANAGTKIAKKDLRPGDLVFFNTNGKNISHVGIYLGDDIMIHSSTTRGVVKDNINDAYYAQRYVTSARVLSDEQYKELTGYITEETVEVVAVEVEEFEVHTVIQTITPLSR